jgi:hypothetical protein
MNARDGRSQMPLLRGHSVTDVGLSKDKSSSIIMRIK